MSFSSMRLLFSLLAIGANVAVLALLGLAVGSRYSAGLASLRHRVEASVAGRELWMAFVVAAVATVGSLYLSEIVDLVPCRLCWFQRVFMYPLAVILLMAAWLEDVEIRRYVYLLAGIGAPISAYHYAVQRYPGLEGGVCDVAAPCSAAYIWQWGFVSIPYMALSAYALTVVLTWTLGRNVRKVS